MKAIDFFQDFFAKVREIDAWRQMEQTVEDSEWHREANVAVHTQMCIEFYIQNIAPQRTERQQMMTLMTLLFHDFGKPEAEEVLERKDGSGTYRRYAGHEPVSANEFMSFVCDHLELMNTFFDQGFDWFDVRRIKVMIEKHLPFGVTNKQKRENLRRMIAQTLGDDEQCFYDQLWSDCNGRISDDHEAKRIACQAWIEEFKAMPVPEAPKSKQIGNRTMYVLSGPVGAGKSTWYKRLCGMNPAENIVLVSEDQYRMDFYDANLDGAEKVRWRSSGSKAAYAEAWQYCFDHASDYQKYVKLAFGEAVASGNTLVVDRTNQTRKSRAPWITAGRAAGYQIISVEFWISEGVSLARQQSRADKAVPANRVHQIFMSMETPWYDVEVDAIVPVPPH